MGAVVRRFASGLAVSAAAAAAGGGVTSGCDASIPGSASIARDSAGIAILHNETAAWSPRSEWRFSGTPRISIGVLEGDPAYQFFNARQAVRLRDGRIVVGDGGSREIRLFDAQGGHLTSFGGEGSGPGEFQRLSWLGMVGTDSVVVYDQPLRRMTVIELSTGELREVSFARSANTFFPMVLGHTSTGEVIAQLIARVRGADLPAGLLRDSLHVLRFSPDARTVDTIGSFAHQIRDVRMRSIGETRRRIPATLPFSPTAVTAFRDDRIWAGTGEAYAIRGYDVDGRLDRILRRSVEAEPITSGDIDRLVGHWRDFYAGRLGNPEIAFFIATLEETPPPERFPAYSSLAIDADENLWVGAFRRPFDEARSWDVFAPDGVWRGTVEGPDGFEAAEFGSDHALGFLTDELDVQRLVLFDLIKPER